MASNAVRWSKLFGSVKGAVINLIHVQALPGEDFVTYRSFKAHGTQHYVVGYLVRVVNFVLSFGMLPTQPGDEDNIFLFTFNIISLSINTCTMYKVTS